MRNLTFIVSFVAISAASLAAGVYGAKWFTAKPRVVTTIDDGESNFDEESAGDTVASAQTIRPKRDPSLAVTVNGLAAVEAFYQTDLRARASGLVKFVGKDIGDPVTAGELLLELEVPDLEQELTHRDSIIGQRRQEVRVAESKLEDAKAALTVAQANVRLKQTEVEVAQATVDFRKKRLDRYRTLAGRDAVGPDVVEEQEREYQAGLAGLAGARVAVEKARADVQERESAIATANAEIGLRHSLVAVAMRDLERARAQADYARVRAPFAGVIIRRNIDPGTFVQNATTGASETLISIARTDLVTVVTRLPENVAPFLTRSTQATLEFDDLPGVSFAGRVTRFTPAVQTSDRTVKVELDLFNDGRAGYEKFVTRLIAANMSAFAARSPISALIFEVVVEHTGREDRKGALDPLPPLPIFAGGAAREPRLLPGMVGTVHLQLQRFTEAYVVPARAVYSRGGKTFLLEVRDGATHLVPVQVQVNDGNVAKVAVVTRVPDGRGGTRESLRELTGREEIVASRQQEFAPGKPVKTSPVDW
jgi:multidrug resistance efflux pump